MIDDTNRSGEHLFDWLTGSVQPAETLTLRATSIIQW